MPKMIMTDEKYKVIYDLQTKEVIAIDKQGRKRAVINGMDMSHAKQAIEGMSELMEAYKKCSFIDWIKY